jgi:tetratricopeptide (TPR) repeat protein
MLDEAIECYTRASNLNPNNAVYLSNRAMCYLKQNRYAQAEVDCTVALALDANYPKAYHRRATARLNLGKLEEAKQDFEQLLRLEPTSKLAQIEINKIENALEKSNLVFPVVKKESERSRKPLVRIKIEDVNVEETSAERAKVRQDFESIQQKIKLNEKDEQLFNTSKPTTSNKIKPEVVKKTNVEQVKTDDVKIGQNAAIKLIPECPNNGYQFKKDWQYLCDNLENLATYLKKIPPIEYPKLFLNGLESDHLAKMLDIFNRFFKKYIFLNRKI